jgi:hypothetical protein
MNKIERTFLWAGSREVTRGNASYQSILVDWGFYTLKNLLELFACFGFGWNDGIKQALGGHGQPMQRDRHESFLLRHYYHHRKWENCTFLDIAVAKWRET